MNSQQLLYINIILFILLVVYFIIFAPRSKKNSVSEEKFEENLEKAEEKTPDVAALTPMEFIAQNQAALTTQKQAETVSVTAEAAPLKPFETPRPIDPSERLPLPGKNTNIFFVYNGHEWESHEVLGLAAGSSIQLATEKYQSLIKTSDPSTFEFYEAAYNSILKKKGSSREG